MQLVVFFDFDDSVISDQDSVTGTKSQRRSDIFQVLLHWAAMYGHHADVEWLLKHGAQVVVYDQLAFHDFRVTIVKPSKQELEKVWLVSRTNTAIDQLFNDVYMYCY